MDTFLLKQSAYLRTIKSQPENCTLDCDNKRNHKMRQRYDECKCSLKCKLKFKINICLISEHINLFHERNAELGCISKNKEVNISQKPTKGVSLIVKNMIEQMCQDDPDETPKRILTKLIKHRKEKSLFNSCLVPKLSQVLLISHLV